jgi:hypothetical protein
LLEDGLVGLQVPALVIDFAVPVKLEGFQAAQDGVAGACEIAGCIQVVDT